MRTIIVSSFAAAIIVATTSLSPFTATGQATQRASTAVPDFSGVYYSTSPGGSGVFAAAPGAAPQQARPAGAAPRPGGATPPRPTRAPVADLAGGRPPNAPSLTPEYLAKWEIIRQSRLDGSYEYDNNAKCLPPGMPGMMSMGYGMEVMQTKDKITFFSELNDALRRVYLDGRKPTANILDDPTYAGYSTGRWEGDTLVVDTVALNDKSFIDGAASPHSEKMTIKERIRFIEPDVLEDRITVIDPDALTKPWEITHTYRKARPGNDHLREFACAEGLAAQ
jgi:hypothetical protein